jgi:hypothetical protein
MTILAMGAAAMEYTPTLKKVPAESVPYGDIICTCGTSVWAAYSGNTLVAVGATKKEAQQKYQRTRLGKPGPHPYRTPDAHPNKPHKLRPGEALGVE